MKLRFICNDMLIYAFWDTLPNIGLSAGFGPLAQRELNVVGHLGTPSGMVTIMVILSVFSMVYMCSDRHFVR